MAALENDVFKLDKVTLTIVGSEPTHVPYMSIQCKIYLHVFIAGANLKSLAVSILRRFETKETEQKSHSINYMPMLEKELNEWLNSAQSVVSEKEAHKFAAHLNSVLQNQNCK